MIVLHVLLILIFILVTWALWENRFGIKRFNKKMQRNLIYTGITRAKKICIIVGTTKALAYSIHNMVVLKRNTRLKERLNNCN